MSTNEVVLARDQGVEFNDYIIGSYDVAVIVNASSPIGNLTHEQVRDLFTGAVQNWKDVGGPDAPVHLYIRHPISGTYLGFRELAMENKPYALHPRTFTNYTELIQAVAQDANGIGYSAIAWPSKAGVKPVSIGGVAPTVESVNKRLYPLCPGASSLHRQVDRKRHWRAALLSLSSHPRDRRSSNRWASRRILDARSDSRSY